MCGGTWEAVGKKVSWCFTPSQRVWLFQGDGGGPRGRGNLQAMEGAGEPSASCKIGSYDH